MATVTITDFGIQTGTDRTVFATWTWSESNTKNYSVRWYYDTGNTNSSGGTIWFIGSEDEVEDKQSTYSAPSNAIRVYVKVKPISETYTSGDSEVSYWTASWSTAKIYNFTSNIPTTPSAPSIKIEKYLLTASLDNVDTDATIIQFQVIKDNDTIFSTGQVTVQTAEETGDYKYAQYSCKVNAGSEYKVRCRGVRNGLYSEWSEYSEKLGTIPYPSAGFTKCYSATATSVYLEWDAVNTATSYNIEYTTKQSYFGSSDQVQIISSIETTRYTKTGLESGNTYFFRLQAVNDNGESAWSKVSSIVIGTAPSAPTTWSSSTTVVVGESLTLYWVHNSEDGSSQTYAELEMYVDGVKTTQTIQNTTDEDLKDKTSSYAVDTSAYSEGTTIQWRVRTKGVTDKYGDWSVQRTIDIYAPPILTLNVTDVNGETFDTLTSFPIYIKGTADPNTQQAIGYHIAITANDTYETVDSLGNTKYVNKGETVYSRFFDNSSELSLTLSASDVNLENNASYKLTGTVSMDSGLSGESSLDFTVAWADSIYRINCMVAIDTSTYTAAICPYCRDATGILPSDVTLSVYRREFDGKFTEIITGVANVRNMFVNDPHPSLDYARYRIVATSGTTGQVEYYDVPAQPVGAKEIVIQWDEQWSNYDADTTDIEATPTWSGSMLKLPYNIDISDSTNRDVVLVEYIGREYPISYHGTQLGSTSTWNTDIPAYDKETIYTLRRLQNWMGDVYVREPSGAGYWANITVSFAKKHCEVVIPVTITVTRVEGGI